MDIDSGSIEQEGMVDLYKIADYIEDDEKDSGKAIQCIIKLKDGRGIAFYLVRDVDEFEKTLGG